MKKKITIIFLTIMLLLALAAGPIAIALSSVTSATLHLAQTEGTVTVTNANGRTLTTSTGMRLYSGYSVATALRSHAYINLENSQAVKLDTNSSSEVRSSGGRLELLLLSGNMFFNIASPVAGNAELNIRTSTTVTGIRGTSGVVKIIDELTTIVYLFTGSVTVQVFDPFTRLTTEVTIYAGQKLTSTDMIDADGNDYVEVRVEFFAEDEVDAFAADEIRKDATLQEEITEQTNLSVTEIIDDVDRKLQEQYEAEDARQVAIDDEFEGLENTVIDPVFVDDGSGDDDTTPVKPTVAISGNIDASDPGDAYMSALSANPGGATIVYSGGTLDFTSGGSIPPGFTVLNQIPGILNVPAGQTLDIQGKLENHDTVFNYGTIEINGNGTFTNNGYLDTEGGIIRNYSSSSFYCTTEGNITGGVLGGDLINGGVRPGFMVLGGMNLHNIKILNNAQSTLVFSDTGGILESLLNYGMITMTDSEFSMDYLENHGSIVISGSDVSSTTIINGVAGSIVTMSGVNNDIYLEDDTGTLTSTFTNNGIFTIGDGYRFETDVGTDAINDASGVFTVNAGARAELYSQRFAGMTMTNSGYLNIYGEVYIDGSSGAIINSNSVGAPREITVDGSSAKIESDSADGAIYAGFGGKITLSGGATVSCTSDDSTTFGIDEGILELSGCTIINTNTGLSINRALHIGNDVTVVSSGSNTISASGSGEGIGVEIDLAVGFNVKLEGFSITSDSLGLDITCEAGGSVDITNITVTAELRCLTFREGGGVVTFSGTNELTCTDPVAGRVFISTILSPGVVPTVNTGGSVTIRLPASGIPDATARLYDDNGVGYDPVLFITSRGSGNDLSAILTPFTTYDGLYGIVAPF